MWPLLHASQPQAITGGFLQIIVGEGSLVLDVISVAEISRVSFRLSERGKPRKES